MIYPVDLSAKYVAYSKSDQSVTRPREWPRHNGMELVGLDADVVMLKVVDGVPPAFDPALEKLTNSRVVDVPGEEYRREYAKTALSQGEIDERQKQADDATEDEAIRKMIQKLKDGSGTNAQRLRRLERVAIRLIQRQI